MKLCRTPILLSEAFFKSNWNPQPSDQTRTLARATDRLTPTAPQTPSPIVQRAGGPQPTQQHYRVNLYHKDDPRQQYSTYETAATSGEDAANKAHAFHQSPIAGARRPEISHARTSVIATPSGGNPPSAGVRRASGLVLSGESGYAEHGMQGNRLRQTATSQTPAHLQYKSGVYSTGRK